ncbi:MAG: hypothetical protein KC563_15990 [Nitrospira sp.]|nr:hypothetical protein [Nitrospira sp.]MCA9466624.1 hypothetical protein [Nitrospira sp.]MCA9477284.1 hypothetical protein [Nitrospira sp.]MCA9480908.1 hypothetical protein [Nitrospira sp.]MCB9711946.1 hypothetical protein [Nitrospiraceae bacterium]
MARSSKVTQGKRNREMAKKMKQQEKESRRLQRKSQEPDTPTLSSDEDPDLLGIRPGPQPPQY